MIASNDDTLGIWETIATDPYITQTLGFAPEDIKRFKNSPDMITQYNKEIHIYPSTAEDSRSKIQKIQIYQIDFFVVAEDYNLANEAKDQCIALLQDKMLKHFHRLELNHPGLILAVPPSHYGVAIRFQTACTIYNKIKR